MEFIKRYWTQILAQLEGLSATQKWLIGCLLIIMLLVGFLLVQYAGQTDRVPISQFSASRADQVLAQLKSAGIDATSAGGQISVPVSQRDNAIAMLVQNDMLTSDSSAAFNKLIADQSPWRTDQQDQQAFLIAKQQVLSAILRKMVGVQSAAVVISMPRNVGFGTTHVPPSASVSLTMRGGHDVDQHLVQAVAGLVSGAVAGMKPQDVVVIDAGAGRQFTVPSPDQMISSDARDLVRSEERYQQQKISEILRYIPGVIVAVRVSNSDIHSKIENQYQYAPQQPLDSEQTSQTSSKNINNAGVPGPQSNVGLAIPGSGGIGTTQTTSKSQTTYQPLPLVDQTHATYSGHTTKQINVSISVPRSYIAEIYNAQNPKSKTSPTNQQLQPLIQQQLTTIKSQVQPLLVAQTPGVVQVAVYPDQMMLHPMTAGSAGTGVAAIIASGWIKPAFVGALALISLLFMLGMVRKATRTDALPSLEELAGVPPTLPSDEDELVGEAEEFNAGMAGVELNEDQIKTRQISEQISDMIKSNPDEAGALLGRWVNVDAR